MTHTRPLILNVDDSDGARYSKTRTLQLAGFDVLEAGTGMEALALVKSRMPDLVLLDVKLPDLNGLEVCRRIKEDRATAAVLVLQTSASFVDTNDRVRGLNGGADNYLVAPIEPLELVANVWALLRLGQVQGELRESEERFRQMAENIDDVFWIFSPHEPRLLYVSPAYETLWGRSADSLYADFSSWLEAVHADDRERVRGAFEALRHNRYYDEEFRILRPDGSSRWIRDRGFPVLDDGGVSYRTARISQDISAHRHSEQLLAEASRRKDEFLATLAHELRNPLGSARSAVELLRLADADTGQHEAHDILSRQLDHLVRLVDDLLDVSRITQGKLILQFSPVALSAVVDAAVETTRAFIASRGHTLQVQLPAAPVWLQGDVVRLAQALGNLLHNAAKYTPAGGTITLSARVHAGRVQIAVADTGIGIAAAALQDIFQLFTQADHCDERAPEGLGVGLSLVKTLIELHGGEVRASSAGAGLGSTFSIDLPVAAQPVAAPPAPAPAPAPSKKSLRILLVDDSADAVRMLKMLLQKFGHVVETASDGPAALALAPVFAPQIALLDIGLPGMDGYEVARALRRMPELDGLMLVALTGYGQDRDRELAHAAGFSHHFVKPLNIDALRALLDTVAAAA